MKWFIYELAEMGKLVDVEGYDDDNLAQERFAARREERLGACIVLSERRKIPVERAERLVAALKVRQDREAKKIAQTKPAAKAKSKKAAPKKKAAKAKTAKAIKAAKAKTVTTKPKVKTAVKKTAAKAKK